MTTYTIVDNSIMDGAKWDDVVGDESTASSKSTTGDKRIVKWRVTDPSWFSALAVPNYKNTEDLFLEMKNQGIWEPN